MSVQSEADIQKDAALESLRLSIKALSKIVIEQCWGHDNWNQDYKNTLKDSLTKLIEIRDNLE